MPWRSTCRSASSSSVRRRRGSEWHRGCPSRSATCAPSSPRIELVFDQSRDPGAPGDVVLGIDPGLSRCGYGAVRREGQRMVPVAFGVLRTPPEAPLPERLAQLQTDLEELFDD